MADDEARGLLPAAPGVDPGGGSPLPLFTYGSLLDAEFLGRLLEHPVASEPASLRGWAVATLDRLEWPVLVAEPGSVVEGRLYRGLDADDWRRIDAYEGVGEGLYQRATAAVTTTGGSEPAAVYLPTGRTLERYG